MATGEGNIDDSKLFEISFGALDVTRNIIRAILNEIILTRHRYSKIMYEQKRCKSK